MLIYSAINPFKKELIQVLTQKKPRKFLKHFVRHIENITWASSLGLSSVASIIHLATATFAIVSVSTGPLFAAVVITGTSLAAIAIILAIATVILHQKLSTSSSPKPKLIESKKVDLAENKIKLSNRTSNAHLSTDVESDDEISEYESSDITSSDVTNTSKKELKQKVSELQETVDDLRLLFKEKKIAENSKRFMAELARRYKLITELESTKVELTEKNLRLEAELKEENENKQHLKKELKHLGEKLKDKTERTAELEEKKRSLKERLKAEIASKNRLKEELDHIGEWEKIAENVMEINAHSISLMSLVELRVHINELTSQRDNGPDSPRRKQLVEKYCMACLEILKLKEELAKCKKENSSKSISRSSPVPRLRLEKKEKKTETKHKHSSKKRKKNTSSSKNQEPVRLPPQPIIPPENSDSDWEILKVSPRNTGQ